MALAKQFGWNNPLTQFVGGNRNLLMGFGAGLAGGRNFGEGVSSGLQGAMQGKMADTLLAQQEEEKAREEEMRQRYAQVLSGWGGEYSDLAEGVLAGGIDPAQAYMTAWERRYQPQAAPEPFTLGAGEVRYDGAGNVIAQGAPDQQELFNREKDLAAQYGQQDPVKTYNAVRNGYERVRASAGLNTGAGDISMIFAYMKMLDPTSVVREGEFATAETAGGAGAQIANLYNRVLSGERLTPELRQEFLAAADALYAETSQNLAATNSQYTPRAQGWGVDPGRFVVTPEAYSPVAPGAAGGLSLTDLLNKYNGHP